MDDALLPGGMLQLLSHFATSSGCPIQLWWHSHEAHSHLLQLTQYCMPQVQQPLLHSGLNLIAKLSAHVDGCLTWLGTSAADFVLVLMTTHSDLPSLTYLELEQKCFEYIIRRTQLAASLGYLTCLQALLVNFSRHPTRQTNRDRSRMFIPQWQAAIQPLTCLTRLQLGFVSLSCVHSFSEQQEQVPKDITASLQNLQHLRVSGYDNDSHNWTLEWVGTCSRLTSLDIPCCSASEVDFEALAQLQQLCSLSLHYYKDELLTTDQLAPLSSCNCLTALHVDALVIKRGHRRSAAGTAAADKAKVEASATAAGNAARPAAAGPPQLSSLRQLHAGVLAQAPVAAWAPNLTQLRDVCVRGCDGSNAFCWLLFQHYNSEDC
jgi:hypothetical protein